MTAGGVSTRVICRSELEGSKALGVNLGVLTETSIRDGLAWLTHHLDSSPLDNFYFLYGLERACVLAGVTHLGKTMWWKAGTRCILDRQQHNGSFLSENRDNGNGRVEIDTCFALLFLKRAVFRAPERSGPVITPSSK
jgi:hypothetical protein